jgi:hypothetical protein
MECIYRGTRPGEGLVGNVVVVRYGDSPAARASLMFPFSNLSPCQISCVDLACESSKGVNKTLDSSNVMLAQPDLACYGILEDKECYTTKSIQFAYLGSDGEATHVRYQ